MFTFTQLLLSLSLLSQKEMVEKVFVHTKSTSGRYGEKKKVSDQSFLRHVKSMPTSLINVNADHSNVAIHKIGQQFDDPFELPPVVGPTKMYSKQALKNSDIKLPQMTHQTNLLRKMSRTLHVEPKLPSEMEMISRTKSLPPIK